MSNKPKEKLYEWKNFGYCSKHGFGSCKCLVLATLPKAYTDKFAKALKKALWADKKSKKSPKPICKER